MVSSRHHQSTSNSPLLHIMIIAWNNGNQLVVKCCDFNGKLDFINHGSSQHHKGALKWRSTGQLFPREYHSDSLFWKFLSILIWGIVNEGIASNKEFPYSEMLWWLSKRSPSLPIKRVEAIENLTYKTILVHKVLFGHSFGELNSQRRILINSVR